MNSVFSDQEIKASFDHVVNELNLRPAHEMSRSGTYFVWLCNKDNVEYLVKVRRKTSPDIHKAFIKEARLNEFFSANHSPFSAPEHVFFYENITPEVLAYTLVPGKALGWYYFFVNHDRAQRIGADKIINALRFLADNTAVIRSVIPLDHTTIEELMASIYAHKDRAISAGLPLTFYNDCVTHAKKFIASWEADSVLVHGDLNPKNIIAVGKSDIGFIDWSDAHLNNKYYDLAFLWLSYWTAPELQQSLLESVGKDSQLFWQAVIYWMPKYFGMLFDTSEALAAEQASGEITAATKERNIKKVALATAYYTERLDSFIKLSQ